MNVFFKVHLIYKGANLLHPSMFKVQDCTRSDVFKVQMGAPAL